ncbi:MAG: hypothetical protein IJF84_03565 [Thermoguttaceae bacterium]|nr:hypothetical protein [Thermoguttaceae bacterium]
MKVKYWIATFVIVYLLFTTYVTVKFVVHVVYTGFAEDSISDFYCCLDECRRNPQLKSELKDSVESYYPSGSRLPKDSAWDGIVEMVRKDVLLQIETVPPDVTEVESLKIKVDLLSSRLDDLQNENMRLQKALEEK